MITTYNLKASGDILVIILKPNANTQSVTTQGKVTCIRNIETGDITGFNIAEIGEKLGLTKQSGPVDLNDTQINIINDEIQKAGFKAELTSFASKLVVGRVQRMTPHPDSDHLHVTTTEVGGGKTLQIVSGSPNMQVGIKVAVAQPGTMMPSGALIWSGELRGVASSGMIVSGRELQLPGAPEKPGALVLPENFGEIGEPFNFKKAQSLYTSGLVDTNY